MPAAGDRIRNYFVSSLHPAGDRIYIICLHIWQSHTVARKTLRCHVPDVPPADTVRDTKMQTTRRWKMGKRSILTELVMCACAASAGYHPRAALHAPGSRAKVIHLGFAA